MIPGDTSTGSKRPKELFGIHHGPRQMVRAEGCRVWDVDGREYLDTIMALGAVALGYADPAVTDAVRRAAAAGAVGPLAPVHEQDVAERLCALIDTIEAVRFLKTGAEAVAAAVRVARVVTGRDHVVTCGYHGWLDWCQDGVGVPDAVRGLRSEIPFNDVAALEQLHDVAPAALVVEPVVDAAPTAEWVAAVRRVADRTGALLVLDEIKTCIRLGTGGAVARYGFTPDLIVLGKAIGNGYPIAVLGGGRDVMAALERTWISSTLATEFVSLAAARAVLEAVAGGADAAIARAGRDFFAGLQQCATRYPDLVAEVRGIPEFCYLAFRSEGVSTHTASRAAAHGLLFKRNAYNFPSAAHDAATVSEVLVRLDRALEDVASSC